MNNFVEDLGRFQTSSDRLMGVVNTARNISATLNPVMILGDSGSGRRELALEIHENSTRRNGRLIRWTASDFGDSRASSVDTVIIENIDSFNSAQQQNLFAIVSDYVELGLMRSPRWIATGCADMMTRIRKENFSVRLYQILSTQVLVLPNLQDRGDDIVTLAERFVDDWNMITGQKKILSSQAKKAIRQMTFARNVSDLFDEIQKVYFKSEVDAIGFENFSAAINAPAAVLPSVDLVGVASVGVTLSEMEKRLILQTLEMTKQNRTRAAEILGISIRTLRNKLQEYRGEVNL